MTVSTIGTLEKRYTPGRYTLPLTSMVISLSLSTEAAVLAVDVDVAELAATFVGSFNGKGAGSIPLVLDVHQITPTNPKPKQPATNNT
jgi:hypothetical protein